MAVTMQPRAAALQFGCSCGRKLPQNQNGRCTACIAEVAQFRRFMRDEITLQQFLQFLADN